MRFGVCAAQNTAATIADAGYDYIELSVAGDLNPYLSDHDWLEIAHGISRMPLCAEAFNSFVRSARIVGPDVDFTQLTHYVSVAAARASSVGGSIIVFGSGGARQIPEGYNAELAATQLQDFLNLCGDEGAKHEVTIVIEPLCSRECNSINLVSQGAELARKTGKLYLMALADTYHMEAENEPIGAITAAADVLCHVHTADTDRYAPGTGIYDHVAMFRALRSAQYDSRLSVECSWQDRLGEQAAASLEHLKSAMAAAHQA